MSTVTSRKRRKRQPGWTLSYRDITQARKRLGIKHPISIRLFKPNDWWWGWVDAPVHTIWLNPTIPKVDVSYTVWHELTHVRQCEHDFGSDYTVFQDSYSVEYNLLYKELDTNWDQFQKNDAAYEEWNARYHTIPLEAEAREIGNRYAERYPLIRA